MNNMYICSHKQAKKFTLKISLLLTFLFTTLQVHANSIQIQYIIQAGDTLQNIEEQYLRPNSLRSLIAINNITNPDLLKIGQILNIPRDLLMAHPTSATVFQLGCQTPPIKENTQEIIKIGTEFFERDIVSIPNLCRVGISFEDNSQIFLPSGATIEFEYLRKNPLEAQPEVRILLTRGRIEVKVDRNDKRTAPFEIKTPRAVMGVRGTSFRVGVDEEQSLLEVLEGEVSTQNERESVNVNRGFGVNLDNESQQILLQPLPAAPFIDNVSFSLDQKSVFIIGVKLESIDHTLIVEHNEFLNFAGIINEISTKDQRFFTSALRKQARIFSLTAQNPANLRGRSQTYAICNHPLPIPTCDIAFKAPEISDVTLGFKLVRIGNTPDQYDAVLFDGPIPHKVPILFLKNLEAGSYEWSLTSSSGDQIERLLNKENFIVMPLQHPLSFN